MYLPPGVILYKYTQYTYIYAILYKYIFILVYICTCIVWNIGYTYIVAVVVGTRIFITRVPEKRNILSIKALCDCKKLTRMIHL